MYLAVGVFSARWSAAVHDEWTKALRRDRPDINPERVARIRSLMNALISDAMVTGFEPLIENLALPDPEDRQVLAAAIQAGASLIVTTNVKHFPLEALAPYNIIAQHVDTFVRGLLEIDIDSALGAFAADRAALMNPPMTVAEYLASLERSGLSQTALMLRTFESAL
jgi:hypothetical protein